MQRLDIPEDVLDFIARRIDSVPHLEALLLFWEDPSHAWTETEVSDRVYVSSEQARMILRDLVRHGILTESAQFPSTYRYESAWDNTQIMQKVAATYRRHLVHVASLIHAKATSGAVQEFARAFKFSRKE